MPTGFQYFRIFYTFAPIRILIVTKMKKLITLSCLLVAFVCAFAQQKVTLQDVADGT